MLATHALIKKPYGASHRQALLMVKRSQQSKIEPWMEGSYAGESELMDAPISANGGEVVIWGV
jgi:hypothetical protein